MDRPVLVFDDPILALPPPPPPPIFLLPPPPPEFIVLPPPPPPIGLFVLPTPVYTPVPVWVQPPVYVAPPPSNNVIFTNIHNTVVINQTTNTVSITTPSGQPVAPPVVQPTPGRGTLPQALAPTGVTAAAIGPSLPPSVAQRASLIQGPRGVAPTAPGQVLPGAGAAPIVPGQPRSGPNALGQPAPTLQPAAAGKPSIGQPLPGANGQPLPPSISAVPGHRNQAGPQRGDNAKPSHRQPLPGAGSPLPSSSTSAGPGKPVSPAAQPSKPGARRSAQPPRPAPGGIPANSNNVAVTPRPGGRPSHAAPAATSHASPQAAATSHASSGPAATSHASPQAAATSHASSGPAATSHASPWAARPGRATARVPAGDASCERKVHEMMPVLPAQVWAAVRSVCDLILLSDTHSLA